MAVESTSSAKNKELTMHRSSNIIKNYHSNIDRESSVPLKIGEHLDEKSDCDNEDHANNNTSCKDLEVDLSISSTTNNKTRPYTTRWIPNLNFRKVGECFILYESKQMRLIVGPHYPGQERCDLYSVSLMNYYI